GSLPTLEEQIKTKLQITKDELARGEYLLLNRHSKSEIEEFEEFQSWKGTSGIYYIIKHLKPDVKKKLKIWKILQENILKTVTGKECPCPLWRFGEISNIDKSETNHRKTSRDNLHQNPVFVGANGLFPRINATELSLETIFYKYHGASNKRPDLPVALQRQVVDLLQCSTQ
ncbi:unnamed protein product, partial [Ranitomeya imitator]